MGTVPRNRPDARTYNEDNLGFGKIFTDHMLSIEYSSERGGWQEPEIRPLENLVFHPATLVLHYGQQVFEGLSEQRHVDCWVCLIDVQAVVYEDITVKIHSKDEALRRNRILTQRNREWQLRRRE